MPNKPIHHVHGETDIWKELHAMHCRALLTVSIMLVLEYAYVFLIAH